VFASELSKYLLKYAPNAPATIVKESPTAIYTHVPADQIPGVVRAYAESLKIVFVVGVPVAVLGLLSSLFIKNIKIQRQAHPKGADTKEDVEKGKDSEDV
jgi:hypothetical protein